jgi:Protein of unknown function (DUF1592)/Protein of unknown function (DUF1588)/Protein of unknown function (DUF1595)/Protein of unknown function (DUF1587)
VRAHTLALCFLTAAASAACVGTIGDTLGNKGSGGTGGGGGSGGSGSSGVASGDSGSSSGSTAPAYLSVRVRRLTALEFDATTAAILGTQQKFGSTFATDYRQDGFTRNAGAVIDSIVAPQIGTAADALAQEAVTNQLNTIAPCTGSNQDTCAQNFITTFGAKAFRRPVTSDEVTALMTVYHAGIVRQAYAQGIQLALSAILQSAGFLYLTELGGTVTSGMTQLTSWEAASALSYFVTGGPPDDTLTKAAAADALKTSDQLGAQATRLLTTPAAKNQIAEFVMQWLRIDTPSSTVVPVNTAASMINETTAFTSEVFFNDQGTLGNLLTANYTFVDSNLATLYNLAAPSSGMSKVSTGGQRIGIFNQGSFLSTYAHGNISAPVKRGHMIRTELLCQTIPPPDPSLMVNMTVTAPTGGNTTRDLDMAHMTNPVCAGCHTLMDPIGFAFENFDGTSAYRSTENGQTIDSTGALNAAGSATGSFATEQELMQRLSSDSDALNCFSTFFFRFASAQNSPDTEAAFAAFLQAQPAATQTRLLDLLVAFVKSDLFIKRSVSQ